MELMGSMFNGMFGKIDSKMCKFAMDGGIAVKVGNTYKKYNAKTGRLVNCDNFVFSMPNEMEMFFLIPTNNVKEGDIILAADGDRRKPKYVRKVNKDSLEVINYENSAVETILPERHVFMGETYFYGKIVSMFGNDITKGKNGGMNNIMKYMMMSEMMKGSSGSGMSAMMPFMMMSGGMEGMFEGMFGMFDEDESVDKTEDKED